MARADGRTKLAFTREVTDEEITVLRDRNALQRLLTVLLDKAVK